MGGRPNDLGHFTRREVHDWKMTGMMALVERLQFARHWGMGGCNEMELNFLGSLLVNSYYQALRWGHDSSFPCKAILGIQAPSKEAFFVWYVEQNKIFVVDNLFCMRKLIMNWCCTCIRD